MEYAPIAILGLLLIYFLLRPIMVLLHELGHAIPVILLTKREAAIYIGSYGEKQASFCIKFGLLSIWIRYNPFKWRGGLCVHTGPRMPAGKKIIYLLGGPVVSFLVSIFFFYCAFHYNMHGLIKEIAVIAAFSGIADAAVNLTPRVITTRTGKVLYSDGYQLMNVRRTENFETRFNEANEWFLQKEYDKARLMYESLLSDGAKNEVVYKMLNQCFLLCKQYEQAITLQKEIEQRFTLTADDLYNMGLAHLFLYKEESQNYFTRALALEPDHFLSLNATGYNLNRQMRFAEALPLFNRAIAGMPNSAHTYNNRGHAKIELGDPEAGLQDIEHSLTLDAANSYAYRNLGIYHLYKGDKATALPLFEKAKEMDKNTDKIEELIEKTR